VPALACNDKHIRVLSGGQIMFEVPTASAPTCLKYVADSHDHHHKWVRVAPRHAASACHCGSPAVARRWCQ
jgi:hypothetical protein